MSFSVPNSSNNLSQTLLAVQQQPQIKDPPSGQNQQNVGKAKRRNTGSRNSATGAVIGINGTPEGTNASKSQLGTITRAATITLSPSATSASLEDNSSQGTFPTVPTASPPNMPPSIAGSESNIFSDENTIVTEGTSQKRSKIKSILSTKSPQSRMLNVIMIWVKNINKQRCLCLSKGFYVWKFSNLSNYQSHPVTTVNNESTIEQKNSYLLLFAENERLREQIAESRRDSFRYEKALRVSAMKTSLQVILRKRLMMRVRYYYDHWLNNTRMKQLVVSQAQRSLELVVGLQEVESERDYVRKTEDENGRLRMFLLLSIHFLKWKSKTSMALLVEERQMYERQRAAILLELRKMRETVSFANRLESGAMHKALIKGQESFETMQLLREKLSLILKPSPAETKS